MSKNSTFYFIRAVDSYDTIIAEARTKRKAFKLAKYFLNNLNTKDILIECWHGTPSTLNREVFNIC